ncbi:MAG: ABC transporter substrate-binding protein [Opitutaceae bacterium]|jgi:iron complex transport system substrate-binding protein
MTHLRQLHIVILLLSGGAAMGLSAAGLNSVGAEARKEAERPAAVRVVSQTVGSDELLLAVARPEQIAALSHLSRDASFSAVAREATRYPQLPVNGDAESALRYSPTLVLCADYSRTELVTQVRRAGVQVIIFDHYMTLEDAYANLRLLAKALGTEDKAERVIASCEERVQALHVRLKDRKPVRVIAPSVYGVIPGAETTFQDICDHAGAENLASTLGKLTGHAAPPAEQMLLWPIDRVVVTGGAIESALRPFKEIPPYQLMAAVKEGRAVLLPSCLLACVSHYRVDAYEELARALHPEAF